jgi:hypothetical protein
VARQGTKKPGTKVSGWNCHQKILQKTQERGLLLVLKLKMLYVDCLLFLHAPCYGRLLEILPGAKLTDRTGLLELSLESFESTLDIFAFLDRYYDHFLEITPFFLAGAKVVKNSFPPKVF